MAIRCRTCGEPIFHLNPRHLFKEENEDVRHNILAITGIRMSYDPYMPIHICSCCYLDLNHSMAFRERCLEANKLLLSAKQEEIARCNKNPLHSQQNDPLDDRDLINKNVIKFKEELNDILDNTENIKVVSQKIPNLKIEDGRKLLTFNQLSPRVRLMRYRDPSDVRPAVLMKRSPSKNYTRPNDTSPQFTASRPMKRIIRSITVNKVKKQKSHVTPLEKKYVCDQCGWSFRDLSNMKDHALRHSGVKRFECEECCRKFFTRPLLMLHVRVHHKGEKPFVCKYCGMAFRNSPSRCRHERKYHATELPFECNICNRTFISKISLEKHKQAHLKGEITHRCETCNKNFKGPTYLKNHYLTKFHLRRINQMVKDDFDDAEMTAISDEDMDFDFPDSIIEEVDE